MVKNPPVNVEDARDAGLIPGWEEPLKKEMGTQSSILAGKPMERGARGAWSMGSQRVAAEHAQGPPC